MSLPFAHLHLHTEYSLLDGVGRISDYMSRAKEFGMQYAAITDHGVMYGVLDWYREARANGISPVIGMEGYMSRGPISDRQDRRPYHIVLLAESEVGYRNLLKLSSRASIEGFYYRPRFDLDMLQEHKEGIIVTSACLAGPVANHLMNDEPDKARDMAEKLLEMFGRDNFYIELQDHGIPEHKKVNPGLIQIARDLDLDLIAANDVHYLNAEDADLQELMVCIQTNKTLDDPNRLKMSSNQLYFKSPQEMELIFGELPDALTNTVKIAERCQFDLEFGRLRLPEPECPPGLNAQQYLEQLCQEGLRWRYPNATEEVRQRLAYELDVIEKTGFPSYLLIVRDFTRYAKQQEIPFGVRGSAAASIVLYTLGITDVDPLANRLVFERFLNIERREMPDIDLDFADNRRQEMIDYAAKKYGHDHVAQIITFGTLGAKAAIRDVARASGWPHGEADRVARLIPTRLNISLDAALEESSDLRKLYDQDHQVTELYDRARRLEGLARHAGTHAAGIVIANDPLVNFLPLQRAPRSSDDDQSLPTTQFPMETVGEIGLLKMDFLGLSNLTILGEAVSIIKERRGIELDPAKLPDGDKATYEMLAKGETFGVFQLESAGMRRYIQQLRPNSIAELSAMVALYRPGPMQHIPQYCSAKHGESEIDYPHPDLAEILDETYGVIVYQDQVLLIAQQFAGYSLGEADIMRKAMGKKIPEKMAAERTKFTEGALARGYSKEDADRIFNLIEPFAGYAFNKAHAVCYGTISYQTAYLKANYPAEYMTAVMRLAPSHPSGATARVAAAVAECVNLGITVSPPDVNCSKVKFSVEEVDDGALSIRFGLSIVKNVGGAAVEALVAAREVNDNEDFASLFDLCNRVDGRQFNKRTLEALIKAGALDNLGDRSMHLASIDRAMSAAQAQQRAAERGQMDLFGGGLADVATTVEPPSDYPMIPRDTLLAWEKEHLGLYMSENPLAEVQERARRQGVRYFQVSEVDRETVGQRHTFLMLIAAVRRITTRTNRTMAVLNLEDLSGPIEAVVFPKTFENVSDRLIEDAIVEVSARVDERRDQLQLIVESITEPEFNKATAGSDQPASKSVLLRLADVSWPQLQQLSELFRTFSGSDQLIIEYGSNGSTKALRLRNGIDWCSDLERAIFDCVGRAALAGVYEPTKGRDFALSA